MRYALRVLVCFLIAMMLGLLGGMFLYVDGSEMTGTASLFVIALALFLVWIGVFHKGGGQAKKD